MEISTISFGARSRDGGCGVCAENGAVSARTRPANSSVAMGFIGRQRSYNLAVSSRLLLATAALAMLVLAVRPAAQQPSLPELLQRSAAYVKRFHTQLAEIVAEETYQQVVHRTSEYQNPVPDNAVRVTLRSDLMLVRPVNADRYVEFRDVFEVDGKTVREPQQRVTTLWRAGST